MTEPPDSPVREVVLDAACPLCGAPGLRMRSLGLDIPYFGDALQTTVLCEDCGFRHADVLLTKAGSPTRHELRVRSPSDLDARVVRSSSGTIRVPELGAAIEPGPRSEAFISNAEGILHRIRDILRFLERNADSPEGRARASDRIRSADRMIGGGEPFTLILDDPFGNSAILHEEATSRPLREDETADLRTGTFTIDLRPPPGSITGGT